MLEWMTSWIWWLGWRSAITFACMFTIQNVIHQEGYRIAWSTMMVASVCAIIGIRIWMPSYKKESHVDD